MTETMSLKNVLAKNIYTEITKTVDSSVFKTDMQLRNKTILITGANGFIAYYLVLTILNANDLMTCGNKVVLLARSEERLRNKYGIILDRDDVTTLIQDVCTPITLDFKVDYVIHAASSADAQHFDADPIGVFNSNVIGTENIIEFVDRNACESAVYISSFTIYGQGTDKLESVTESFCGPEPWDNNRACYAYGKRSAEFLCMAAARKNGTPLKIVRPGFVYGASSKNDTRVYAEIIRCVAENRPVTLQSAGLLYRSMIYVTDLVNAILAVLANGKNGEAYNVANEHVSIRQFAENAVTAAGNECVKLAFRNESDAEVTPPENVMGAMSIGKIASECNWKPCVPLTEGIASAARIYTELE